MSKPTIEIINPGKDTSFIARKFDKRAFDAPLHFHPEIELTCILKGKGKRFVGNNMSGFEENDLVLLGPNIPHCWKLEPLPQASASSIVVHFDPYFLGKDFFSLPEMQDLKSLIKRAEGGVVFFEKTKNAIIETMAMISEQKKPFERTMQLLSILNQLASSKKYLILNKKNVVPHPDTDPHKRIHNALAYIVENFKEQVSLEEVSSVVGLTPNAFCKYFKKLTRKTFIQTVTDYRINYSRQLLTETDKSISDICFESGFGDMSHFYKTFYLKMKVSPSNYRKQYLQDTITNN